MKVKGLRKLLIGIMCSAFIASGAIAYASFDKASVAKADVTVSADIQKVIDGFNNASDPNGGAVTKYRAKYVTNYTLKNGSTGHSGVLLTIDTSSDSGLTYEQIALPSVNVNLAGLTYNDKMLGYIINPGVQDSGNITGFEAHIIGANGTGFTYMHVPGNDGADNATTQKVATMIRRFNSTTSYNIIGLYWQGGTYPQFNYGNRGFKKVSLQGHQTVAHNIYYDYAQNALYNDYYNLHLSDQYELASYLNVNPKTYASLGSINPWPITRPTETGSLVNYTGSNEFFPVQGFENGVGKIGIRCNVISGTVNHILLTAYAGIDLTNPTNVAPDKTFVNVSSDTATIYRGVTSAFPEATINDYFGGAKVSDFTGKVNIYKGSRAFKGAYGSVGAPANAVADGLTLVASNVDYSAGYNFAEDGAYTLEYVANDGKVAYKSVNVIYDAIKISTKIGEVTVSDLASKFVFDDENATITKGTGTAIGSGASYNGFKVNVTKNSTLTFDQVFNLSGYSYVNRNINTPFIGMMPIPKNALVGTIPDNADMGGALGDGSVVLNNEFEKIEVVLTDAHDETNKIRIVFGTSPAGVTLAGSGDGPNVDGNTYYNSQVDVYAEKGGTSYTGGRAYNKGYGVRYGAVRQFSYLGYSQEPLNLIYDYQKNALFTNVTGNKNSGVADSYLLKYLGVPAGDYDKIPDPDNGGYYKANKDEGAFQTTWGGFTTGEVKVSINFTLPEGVTDANLLITNLMGLDLSGDVAEVKSYTNYFDTEKLPEYSPAGEITLPKLTLKNTMLADYSDEYEGNVAVRFNGTDVATVVAGNAYNMNKPGKYEFVYAMEGGREFVLSTSVKAIVNLAVKGLGGISIDGEVYGNGDELATITDVNGIITYSDDWYFDEIKLFDANTLTAIPYVLDGKNLSFKVGDLSVDTTLELSVREYYVVEYVVQGKTYKTFKLKQGENFVLPDVNPSVEGYNFVNWVKGDEVINTSSVLEKTADNYTDVVVVNANLNAIIYTANIALAKEFNGLATMNASSAIYTIETGLEGFAIPTVTDSNYVFAGWFYNGKLVKSGADLPCANGATVYAYLTKPYKTITYIDGVNVIGVDNVLNGEKTASKDVIKDGYALEGWYTDVQRTQKYAFGSTLNSNVTLYAKWVKVDSSVVDGANESQVNNEASVINDSGVGAFSNINILGIITMVLTVIGFAVAVAMGVIIIIKNKK